MSGSVAAHTSKEYMEDLHFAFHQMTHRTKLLDEILCSLAAKAYASQWRRWSCSGPTAAKQIAVL